MKIELINGDCLEEMDKRIKMLEVKKNPCEQCLFSNNKIVSEARKNHILDDCREKDYHFSCHEGTIDDKDIICSGFYREKTSNLIRIMQRLKGIRFVD